MEHAFSVEMKSKAYIKNISISNEAHDRVLFEGSLGELTKISIAEGDVLEIIGVNGTLRVDLSEEQLSEVLEAHRGLILSSPVGE
ncbi:MAG: hypothetical protein ABSA11_12910 [Candidatus Bathyarchaeia archaeon]|jgi:hypothetical protein